MHELLNIFKNDIKQEEELAIFRAISSAKQMQPKIHPSDQIKRRMIPQDYLMYVNILNLINFNEIYVCDCLPQTKEENDAFIDTLQNHYLHTNNHVISKPQTGYPAAVLIRSKKKFSNLLYKILIFFFQYYRILVSMPNF